MHFRHSLARLRRGLQRGKAECYGDSPPVRYFFNFTIIRFRAIIKQFRICHPYLDGLSYSGESTKYGIIHRYLICSVMYWIGTNRSGRRVVGAVRHDVLGVIQLLKVLFKSWKLALFANKIDTMYQSCHEKFGNGGSAPPPLDQPHWCQPDPNLWGPNVTPYHHIIACPCCTFSVVCSHVDFPHKIDDSEMTTIIGPFSFMIHC